LVGRSAILKRLGMRLRTFTPITKPGEKRITGFAILTLGLDLRARRHDCALHRRGAGPAEAG
jgi:hypothetical protein